MTRLTVRRANRYAAGGAIVLAMVLATTAGCSDSDDEHKAWTLYTAAFEDGRKISTGTISFAISGDLVTHTFEHRPVNSTRTATSRSASSRPAFMNPAIRTRIVETRDGKPLSWSHRSTYPDGDTFFHRYTIDRDGKVRTTMYSRPPPGRRSSGPSSRPSFWSSPNASHEPVRDWPDGAIEVYGQRLLARKHGLAEGTSYTYKVYAGSGKAVEVTVRVGKKTTVDVLGDTMKLTEVVGTWRRASDPAPNVTTTYVDDDYIARKTRYVRDGHETVWYLSNSEQAVRDAK